MCYHSPSKKEKYCPLADEHDRHITRALSEKLGREMQEQGKQLMRHRSTSPASRYTKVGGKFMSSVKERISEIIQEQPDDSTYEEILRELVFARMVERGLEDSRKGRLVSNEEMERRIRTWSQLNPPPGQ